TIPDPVRVSRNHAKGARFAAVVPAGTACLRPRRCQPNTGLDPADAGITQRLLPPSLASLARQTGWPCGRPHRADLNASCPILCETWLTCGFPVSRLKVPRRATICRPFPISAINRNIQKVWHVLEPRPSLCRRNRNGTDASCVL